MADIPPAVPDQVLQQEMLSGSLAGPLRGLEELRRQVKLHQNRALLYLGAMGLLWLSLGFSLALVERVLAGQQAIVIGAVMVLGVHAALGVFALVRCCLSFAQASEARAKYCQDYKETLFPAAIRLLNPTFQYQPRWGIPFQSFSDSRMFLHHVERYWSTEYVQGVQGATAFVFANVWADYRPERTVQLPNDYQALFHGLYFIADFNKHFAHPVLVLPRSGEQLGLITGLLDKWGRKRGQVVRLEDPEFDREFVVHAEDEVEVRYLLTPALMQRILDLRRTQGRRVSLSFFQEKLHIALEGAENRFPVPDPGCSAYSLAPLQQFLNQVRSTLLVIQMLHLNTRIWSKR